MGGRGAGSGLAPYPGRGGKMFRHGEDFRSLWQSDEIKYVTVRNPDDKRRFPRAIKTPSRVYAFIGIGGAVRSVGIYDENGIIEREIDLDHFCDGLDADILKDACPHDGEKALDADEEALLSRVLKKWRVYNGQHNGGYCFRRVPDCQTEENWRVLLEKYGHIWFVLDGQRYFVFSKGHHKYGLCLGEDAKTGNIARWVFNSEDEFLNARVFAGRSILERLDEVLVYAP